MKHYKISQSNKIYSYFWARCCVGQVT